MGRRTRRAWNRWLWQTANAIVDRVINRTVAPSLRAAGLPKVRHFFSQPADRVIVALPERLFKRPDAEIDPRFKFTGYCRWQAPAAPPIDAELTAFTGGAPVPLITFGSMVYENAGAVMERLVRAWPRHRKLIVQRGWAQFPQLGDESAIKVIGKVSHDQVFRHASVIIHHGGAGTTASALHAGVPQIVVPHIGDQNFFGLEMERLGVGLRIGKATWPESLAGTVDRLLHDPARARRAKIIAADVNHEDGPAQAIAALEAFVSESKAARSAPNLSWSRAR